MPNSSNYNNSLDNSLTDNPLVSGLPERGILELDDRLPEIGSQEIAPYEDIPILDETDKLLSGNGILRTWKEETIEIGDADPLLGETSEDSPAENVSESDPLTNPIESSETSDEGDGDTETLQEAIESPDTSEETETSPTQSENIEASENLDSEDSEGEDSDEDESPDAIESADADNTELPPVELPEFDSGIFTVNGNGEVGVDFLHDGGKFKFELAIFSLEGMEEFWSDDDSTAFIAEAARRAASGSELGHVVISDAAEGAKFSASLEGGQDWNAGNYTGVKTFQMRPGDTFAMMLVPNGKVSQVLANPEVGGQKRPLFSLATANPDDGLHFGQIADVTGDGSTFVMEDMRIDGNSDFDYNDLIFQIRGATGTAGLLDDAIDPEKDWRETDLGQALIEYAKPYITPESPGGGESVDDGDPDNPDDGTDGAIDPPVDDGETPSEEVTDDGEEDTDDNSGDSVTDEVTDESGESPTEDTQNTDDDSEDDHTDEVTGDGGESLTEDTHSHDDHSEDDHTDEVTGESGESLTEDTHSHDDHSEDDHSHHHTHEHHLIDIYETIPPERVEFPRENQPLIGIIDTGFATNNPDIDYSNVTLGSDRVNGDDNPLQASGEGSEHGTHILGIIAAEQDNGVGIDGINDDAPIWVGQAIGSGDWAESLVEFVDAAKESGQPNAVVNLSFDLTQVDAQGNVTTRYEFTPEERAAIEYARQNDVLLVVAAGNDGDVMSVLGQASQEFDNILTVGSAQEFDSETSDEQEVHRTDYSSYGAGLDLMAFGGTPDNPELSLTGDGVGTMSGTSVATAKVTGIASQVWASNPDLSYRQVIEILKNTATDLGATGDDEETGAGLVNMTAAIDLAKETTPEEHTVLPTLIPDTWTGEGITTPSERAVATQFNGKYYNWKPYRIQRGDTLSGIAYRTMGNGSASYYNFIAKKNGIANPNWISVGAQILVPDEVPPPGNLNNTVGFDGRSTHQTYINTYNRNGGKARMGSPSGNVLPWEKGYTQKFSGSPEGDGAIMKSNRNNSSYWVAGKFWKQYIATGGAGGILGYPVGDRYPAARNSVRQNFEGGAIILSSKGLFSLYGAIGAHYRKNEGAEAGRLGLPISPEIPIGGGKVIQKFENGRIVFGDGPTRTEMNGQQSVTIGGHNIGGKFYPIWESYRGTIGNPTSRVYNHSNGASFQIFEKGSIVSSRHGTFPLFGAVRQTYLNIGGLDGWLGAPKSAERRSKNGFIRQDFEGGYVIWNGREAIPYRHGGGGNNPGSNTPKPGGFQNPLAGSWYSIGRLNEFGTPRTISGTHKGIDLSTGRTTPPIKAATGGKVVIANYGWNYGYGNYIKIDHGNGVETRYAHLSTIKVKPGQTVKAGTHIGNVGSTGNSTGPHLHFEIRVNNVAQNPRKYIKF